MNTPTKLTISRIVVTIIMIILLLFPFYQLGIEFPKFLIGGIYVKSQFIVAGILFLLASITDFLDGYLARKHHQVTDLGKMLDAIADKVLVNSALIILAVKGFIPGFVPVVIIFRDTVVDALKMEAASHGKVVAAITSGKIKTAAMMSGVVLRVADFLIYFATIMSIVSMIEYFQVCKSIFVKKN